MKLSEAVEIVREHAKAWLESDAPHQQRPGLAMHTVMNAADVMLIEKGDTDATDLHAFAEHVRGVHKQRQEAERRARDAEAAAVVQTPSAPIESAPTPALDTNPAVTDAPQANPPPAEAPFSVNLGHSSDDAGYSHSDAPSVSSDTGSSSTSC